MKRFLFLVVICLMPILFYACDSVSTINVGKIQYITKNVTNFNGIDIGHSINAEITISDVEEVIVEAGENLHPYIVVEVVNNVLKIYYKKGENFIINGDLPKIHIKMKDLLTLEQSGVTDVSLNSNGFEFSTVSCNIADKSVFSANNLIGNKLELKLSGISYFNCSELIVENCDFNISGNGAIRIAKGTCDKLKLNSSLTGLFCLSTDFGFVSQYADLKLKYASKAELTVEKEFAIEASGTSHCSYKGNPTITKMEITDTASLEKN